MEEKIFGVSNHGCSQSEESYGDGEYGGEGGLCRIAVRVVVMS